MDLVQGLGESVRMEWSGDTDLNDGKLQQQYKRYIARLDFLKGLGLEERRTQSLLIKDLHTVSDELVSDLTSTNTCKYSDKCLCILGEFVPFFSVDEGKHGVQ